MKITANLPKHIVIEFPEIPDNATPDEIREKIPQIVRTRIELEQLLRELRKVITKYNRLLEQGSIPTADYESIKKIISIVDSIKL